MSYKNPGILTGVFACQVESQFENLSISKRVMNVVIVPPRGGFARSLVGRFLLITFVMGERIRLPAFRGKGVR